MSRVRTRLSLGEVKPKPLRQFDIHPDGGWIHFSVFIWKTKTDMHAALSPQQPNYEAISLGGHNYKLIGNRWRFTGRIGQLHFYNDSVRTGIITHECCHAAHSYFRFRKRMCPIVLPKQADRSKCSEREEAFCWIMGNLVREFTLCLHHKRKGLKCAPNWFKQVPFFKVSYPKNWDGVEKSLTQRR